jgi:lipopolysaccharide transport system permease protein
MISRAYEYYRDLVAVLVAKEFKVRYKSTFFGYAWSVLHPLAFAGVFYIMFKIIVRIKMDDYVLFLICGLFPWQWFQNSVNASNFSFLNNASLIKKVKFPRAFLALAGVLNDTIHFVISIPVIAIFMVCYGKYPSLSWLWQIPVLAAITFTFTYGASLLVATCNLFFRDLERLTIILTMLWFYLTPILYPVEMIPPKYVWALYANPMTPVIVCWRKIFLEGVLPFDFCLAGACMAGLVYIAGRNVYTALQWRFAEIV